MTETLKEKIYEAFSSVLPITAIVLVLSIFVVPLEVGTIVMFLSGAALLVIGMGFFSLGADTAMLPIGEGIGASMSKSKNLGIIIFLGFLIGVIVTIAEPDLQVLAEQVHSIDKNVLILCVALGVGLCLALVIIRTLFQVSLRLMLLISYAIIFLLILFAPDSIVTVAFDAGGVTTGPITVPFIMSIGVGLALMRGDKEASNDSFGYLALSSVGPVIVVLLLGIFFQPSTSVYEPMQIPSVVTMQDVFRAFTRELPVYAKEVAMSFIPIIIMSVIFQLITKRMKPKHLMKIGVGFVYTYVGLVLFLTGVNVGFIAVGLLLGKELVTSAHPYAIIPIGMVVGYFVVAAEPAVLVLNKQVEEVTNGAISPKAMQYALSIGVAISVGLSLLRVLTGISVYWFLLPGYAISLILMFFVPKIFIGIAFDSGGVASGSMAATFLLPLAIGACEGVGGNVMQDAFGIIALVAMTPLIAIQIMGMLYGVRSKKEAKEQAIQDAILLEETMAAQEHMDDIIEFEEEGADA